MYSVFVALAIGIILLNWVWQLFKNFGLGAGVEAEDPVKLSIRSVIFILLTLFSDEIVNIVLTIGGTPYHWIMDSDLPALSFADFNSVMLVIIGVCANGAVALIMYASSVSKGGNFANNVIGSVATGSISQMGAISGEKAAEALHSYMGYAALESGAENVPTFQNVEIGGGRITGTEVTAEHPEGISFGMYHADQYVAPEGQYTTVHAVDGTAWYKQYAVDAVDKSPYMAPDGSIAFNESIVKKLPPAPRRKDKI